MGGRGARAGADAGELLAALASRQDVGAAAGPLRELVVRLASMRLRARDGLSYRIPPAAREDVVQAVLLKVLERSPLPVVGQGEAACRAYLSTMVVHEWLGQRRRSARLTGGAVGERAVERAPSPAPPADLEAARGLLERLAGAAREARAPRYRDDHDRTWRQIVALCFGDQSMADVLERDAGVTEVTPAHERKRAVDRVLKAHQRTREELLAAVERLYAAGELSWVEAARGRAACRLLFRCQRRPARDVPGGGG